MASAQVYRPYISSTTTTQESSRRAGYDAPRGPAIVASRAIPNGLGSHRSPIGGPYRNSYASSIANSSAGPSGSYRIEIDRTHPEREVIVIGDSPSPPPTGPIRRDIEAQAGTSRKRKADDGPVVINGYNSDLPYAQPAPAFAPTADKKRKLGDELAASRTFKAPRRDPPSKKAEPVPCDDKDGHFIPRAGETLGDPKTKSSNRYKIVRLLGQGTFGKVVEAIDTHATDPNARRVAIKVIRAVQKYRDASKVEIKVLRTLSTRDPDNVKQCIHMREWFDDRNHICLVTDLLGPSVFDFLKDNAYEPFPMCHIQTFAKQLLRSVEFLHDLRLVHTDLKPENILLRDAASVVRPVRTKQSRTQGPKTYKVLKQPDIFLIDFGSATFEHEYHATVVSTRHYRAPEIILGMGWSYPCDVWSIGCILVELYTGEALFQTHENVEHLAMMDTVFGRMPDSMAREGSRNKPEWFRGSRLDFPNSQTTRQSKKFVKLLRPLHDIVPENSIALTRFLDLLKQLLAWDPNRRVTVEGALQHPFFQLDLSAEQKALIGD